MFNYLKNKFAKYNIVNLLLVALLIRLALAPFFFHSDLNNHAIWGRYAQEFGFRGFYDWLNFGNYAWPGYPPFAHFIFLFCRMVWQYLFNIFWFLNVKLPLFPSNFIPWFEESGYLFVLKIPGIIADIFIGYYIYKYVAAIKNQATGKLAASLFLFNPAMIYLSALWGQLESIIGLFVLIAAIFLVSKQHIKTALNFLVSLMVKVTVILVAPIFLIEAIKNKIKKKEVIFSTLLILLVVFATSFIYIDRNYFSWFTNLYWTLSKGPSTLQFINLNAFNFWGIIFGLERLSKYAIYMGMSITSWAWLISGILFLLIFVKSFKNQNLFFSLTIMFFAAFMFLPRVHERYLYPMFVFFPLVLAKFPKLLKHFLLVSIVFFLNLYHWWWVPRVDILVNFLDLEIIERGLSLVNLVIFGYLFKIYLSKA